MRFHCWQQQYKSIKASQSEISRHSIYLNIATLMADIMTSKKDSIPFMDEGNNGSVPT